MMAISLKMTSPKRRPLRATEAECWALRRTEILRKCPEWTQGFGEIVISCTN